MKSQMLKLPTLEKELPGYHSRQKLLPGELRGVSTDLYSVKGPCTITEPPSQYSWDVILSLEGKAFLEIEGIRHLFCDQSVLSIPYLKAYSIHAEKDQEVSFIRIRISLDDADLLYAAGKMKDHARLYAKAFSDCPVYTEEIKSSKSVNRMILPEGLVPRFCMGSVETSGPDIVAKHSHPMLDQLFLGLPGCRCTCFAGKEQILLEENLLLHIPLGSEHYIEVEAGNRLAYIWFDFFLSLEGQTYMSEQHHIEEP